MVVVNGSRLAVSRGFMSCHATCGSDAFRRSGWPMAWPVLVEEVEPGSAGLPFLDGGDELAAERRDVGDHATPHKVAITEGRLVHPGRARVHQIVLDPQAAGG